MLVLSRTQDEQVVIEVPASDVPTRVVVTLVENRTFKARIGFDAPKEVSVNRKEVQDLIDQGKGYKR